MPRQTSAESVGARRAEEVMRRNGDAEMEQVRLGTRAERLRKKGDAALLLHEGSGRVPEPAPTQPRRPQCIIII